MLFTRVLLVTRVAVLCFVLLPSTALCSYYCVRFLFARAHVDLWKARLRNSPGHLNMLPFTGGVNGGVKNSKGAIVRVIGMQNTAALLLGPSSVLMKICCIFAPWSVSRFLLCVALGLFPFRGQLNQPGSHEARPYNALGEPKQPYPISTENKVNFDMFSR